MQENTITEDLNKELKCGGCGAYLTYAPGTRHLTCGYCGTKNEIVLPAVAIEELDFTTHAPLVIDQSQCQELTLVKCTSCGAETTLLPHVTSSECPFCTTTLVLKDGGKKSVLKPKSLLPFKITAKEAFAKFGGWINSLWFAPNDLKKYATSTEKMSGLYIPYWTFDCDTQSAYSGEKGINHYETYTTTENGKPVQKTRVVTRWHSVSGEVYKTFDDVLVKASRSLPDKYCRALEPWDLPQLVPYDDKFLSGFKTESYQIGLEEGLETGKTIMAETIREVICHDIGGDHQRIHSVNTAYAHITFKHILLPVYISAYKYKGKIYRILVNGRTGEVQGERPYSWIKIAFAVLAGLALLSLFFYFTNYQT